MSLAFNESHQELVSVGHDIDRSTEQTKRLMEVTERLTALYDQDEVATESVDFFTEYHAIVISTEGAAEVLWNVWKTIRKGIDASMARLAIWYEKLTNGFDQFIIKAKALVETAKTFNGHGSLAQPNVTLQTEHRKLFLTSTEKGPTPLLAFREVSVLLKQVMGEEFKDNYSRADDYLGRLTIDIKNVSESMSEETQKELMREIRGDLELSGLGMNMGHPSFKTKLFTTRDSKTTTNKARLLYSGYPLPGGYNLVLQGPAYNSFNHDGMGASGNVDFSRYVSAARERAGVTATVERMQTVSYPRHYEREIRVEPLAIADITKVCENIIDYLDEMRKHARDFERAATLKKKLLKGGESLLSGLKEEPTRKWTQVLAFKQSMINYHVARIDSLQNGYVRYSMQVIHAILRFCERSLWAYA